MYGSRLLSVMPRNWVNSPLMPLLSPEVDMHQSRLPRGKCIGGLTLSMDKVNLQETVESIDVMEASMCVAKKLHP